MSYQSTNSIEVVIWGRPVGALIFDPGSGAYAFEYFNDFKRSNLELAPLAIPLSTNGAVSFPQLPRETYFGLPAFIADSLPDAFGNALIDRWMSTQGFARQEITALDRLAYLGKRGMGALEFKPMLKTGESKPSALEVGELVETARRALAISGHAGHARHVGHVGQVGNDPLWHAPSAGDTKSSQETADEWAELIAVGTSAGGARAKAVVGYSESTDTFLSGQFALPAGYDYWLIKFDLGSDTGAHGTPPHDYGRIEYAYYLMAQACGIEMAPSRLYETGGRAHFMTRRFDRVRESELKGGRKGEQNGPEGKQGWREDAQGKLHQQTLCAMAHLDFRQRDAHDYNQLLMVLEELNLGYEAIDQVFLRMVFSVCTANHDDHTKNHSFLMTPEGTWKLAPAYDLTHAYRKDSIWVSRHLMSVNGRFEGITRDDTLRVAQRFQVATPQNLIKAVLDVASHWPDFARQACVSKEATERIQSDISQFSSYF